MRQHPWLKSAWSMFRDRLKKGQMPHALLIQGPAGTGKTGLADAIAARLVCTSDGECACGQCRSCDLFQGGAHPDYFRLEPEEGKQQIVIEQVRALIGGLSLTTSFSQRKVALIVPAEAMNRNSANALLKCLEEPPGETVMILVSHDASRLPVTIRSRCQSIAVRLPAEDLALQWLQDHAGLAASDAAGALKAAAGSPLQAVGIAKAGLVPAHQKLRKTLSALLGRPGLAAGAASECEELEASLLWKWLSDSSAEALRGLMTGAFPAWLEEAPDMDSRILAALQKSADRNRALTATPVRQDLLLREWLIKWSRLEA